MEGKMDLTFQPSLYKQRYLKVLDLLSVKKPKKIVDFGCAECKFLQFACRETYIEELIGVDIDFNVLEKSKNKLKPLITDFINLRIKPLTIKLYQGTVNEPSSQLFECEAAVCIELIEHLYPSNLKLFSKNVFGTLKPNMVVISTPNADFNELFKLNGNLRHWDHKFEWTRVEFQKWCHVICKKYHYLVQFSGVGQPPPRHSHLGQCSQVAVFERKNKCSHFCQNNIGMQSFSLVHETTYPCLNIEQHYKEILHVKITELTRNIVAACLKENDRFVKNSFADSCTKKLNAFNYDRNESQGGTNVKRRVFTCTEGQFSDYENDLDVFDKHSASQNICTVMKSTVATFGHKKAFQKFMQKIKQVNDKPPEKHQFDNPVMDVLFKCGSCTTNSPLSKALHFYFKNMSFMFDVILSSQPCIQTNMLNFCHSTTVIPILLFVKILQFECGFHDLIMLIDANKINGISMNCEQNVTILNQGFWDDPYQDFSSECSSENHEQSLRSQVSEEDWDNQ